MQTEAGEVMWRDAETWYVRDLSSARHHQPQPPAQTFSPVVWNGWETRKLKRSAVCPAAISVEKYLASLRPALPWHA